MNPVAMQEVNRARRQDLNRAAEARRRASAASAGQRGLVTAMLEKVGGLIDRRERLPALRSEKKRGVSAT